MCGRFAQTKELTELISRFHFDVIAFDLPPSFNIAPTQYAGVVYLQSGKRIFEPMKWGLIPFWSKDSSMGGRMINARAETVDSKPAFRQAIKRKRCLVLSDGFYEWDKKKKTSGSSPYFFFLKDRKPFAFAGLWDEWQDQSDSPIHTFTIITTKANSLVAPLHDRMPVIMKTENEAGWLDPGIFRPQEVKALLDPVSEDEMDVYAVTPYVNSPKNNSPRCLKKGGGNVQPDMF